MARGWESKSVEMQLESTESARERRAAPGLSAVQAARERARESVELSRTRILHDLDKANHPRYRALLLASLEFLDQKLKRLE